MSIVGLITEYNPFHNGHYYHIEQAKRLTGASRAVVIMSGNFVQRGAPALLPKHERTQMALRNGADLVLELPVVHATASAEYFAEGAISLLSSLGIVDSVCFGSECGDVKLLEFIADILLEEPAAYQTELQALLKTGLSYPLARSRALLHFLKQHEDTLLVNSLEEVLASPNNILGIEYIKALKKCHSQIIPYALTRIVSGYHDTGMDASICSATALRQALSDRNDTRTLIAHMPESAWSILHTCCQNSGPLYENDLSLLLKYQLLHETKESLCAYADISAELAARIINHRNSLLNWQQFCALLKTKDLTYSRISRALLHIVLHIHTDMQHHRTPPYVRILGFRRDASELLRLIKQNSSAPLVTKLADASSYLTKPALEVLQHELYTSAVYHSVAADKYKQPCLNEYQIPLVIV